MAVNVTSCPTIEGLGDELTFVVVGEAGATTLWVTDDDMLPSELTSPAYVAVTT